MPEKFKLRELLATTLGALTATTPLIVYKMGTSSLFSLPTNILVLPLVPATMYFGFFAAMFDLISPLLAFPFVAISWVMLQYQLFVVNFFSLLPFASVNITLSQLGIAIGAILIVWATLKLFVWKRDVSPVDDWEITEM